MNICNYKCLPEKTQTCCVKTKVIKLIQKADLAKFEVELFEMQPAGYSPLHSHKILHAILVLEGEGIVFDGEKNTPIHVDDVVYIMANEQHQFRNIGKKPLKFLCVSNPIKE